MSSLMLPQLLGLYFLIVGVIVVARRSSIMPAIAQIVANRPLLLVIALAELLAGLAIILNYSEVSFKTDGVIAAIGWILVVEGIVYLALPMKTVQRMIKVFNKPEWYAAGGVLSVVIGAYLSIVGFGMM